MIRGANGLNIKVMELWINDMLFLAKSAGDTVSPVAAGGTATAASNTLGSPTSAAAAAAAEKGATEEKDVL